MATRRAVVINDQGLQTELPKGDTLAGIPIGLQVVLAAGNGSTMAVYGIEDPSIGPYIPVYTASSSVIKVRASTNG